MKDGSPKAAVFVAIVFVLFGAYASYAAFLTGVPDQWPFVQGIAAKGGEDSEDSGSDDSKSEDSDDDSKSEKDDDKSEDKAAKEAEKKAKEAAKQKQEAAKRAAKATQSSGSSSRSSDDDVVNGVKLRGDGSVDDSQDVSETSESDESELTEDSESGDSSRDAAKTKERLAKKLAQAEEKILKKQAEGVDVSAALAALALAKEKAAGVDALLAANQLDQVEALTKETERLAHAARGKVLHASERITKDVAKVDKRISQTKGKLSALEAAGGDASSYRDRLAAVETEWAGVKSAINAGGEGVAAALAQVEPIERKVKVIKNAVESALFALGADDDGFETSEYADEMSESSNDLADLAEIAGDEEGDHDGLKRLAKAHKDDADEAAELVKRYESRSVGMRQLFGDDKDSLESLKGLIAANEARIEAMETVVATVSDQEIAALMLSKIADLKEQNASLQAYVDAHPAKSGVFGWLFNWF